MGIEAAMWNDMPGSPTWWPGWQQERTVRAEECEAGKEQMGQAAAEPSSLGTPPPIDPLIVFFFSSFSCSFVAILLSKGAGDTPI